LADGGSITPKNYSKLAMWHERHTASVHVYETTETDTYDYQPLLSPFKRNLRTTDLTMFLKGAANIQ
jgi:hypothetical protein